jgi:WD40 repeat protein
MSDFVIETNSENTNIDEDKSHNDKPISKIAISPNEEYLVTYSEDNRSIVGWNVRDEGSFKPELFVKLDSDKSLYQISISDDKKLACIDNYESLLSKS